MAEPLRFSDNQIKAIRRAREIPDDPRSKRVLEIFTQKTGSGEFENPFDKPEQKRPSFAGGILGGSVRQIKEQAAAPAPLIQDKDVSSIENIQDVGKQILGFTIGVAEAVNPLSIPRQIETLGRAGIELSKTFESSRPFFEQVGQSLERADLESKLPRLDIDEIAANIRASIRTLPDLITGNVPSQREFLDIVSEEKGIQKTALEDIRGARTAGELTTGIASVGLLVKELGPVAARKLIALRGLRKLDPSKVVQGAKGLLERVKEVPKGFALRRSQARSKKALAEAEKLQKQLAGEIAPDLKKAITDRFDKVEELLKGPREAREIFPVVERFRETLDEADALILETLKEFRSLLKSDRITKFETDELFTLFDSLKRDLTPTDGVFLQFASAKDKVLISKYENILKRTSPKGEVVRNNLTTRDTIVTMDSLDDDLDLFYQFNSAGKRKTDSQTLRTLNKLRQELDAGLQGTIPAYKETKTAFVTYKKNLDNVGNRIRGERGESFVSNLFSKGKTDTRRAVDDLSKSGKELVDSLGNLTGKVKTGTAIKNKAAQKFIQSIKENAKKVELPESRHFLNDIADRLAAQRLEGFRLGGVTDFEADKIARIVRDTVRKWEKRGAFVGDVIGVTIGSAVSGSTGSLTGLLLGKSFGSAIGRSLGIKRVKKNLDITRVFDLIRKSKTADKETIKLMKELADVKKVLPSESFDKFLNFVNMTTNLENEFQKAIAAGGAIQSILPGSPQGFAQSIGVQ